MEWQPPYDPTVGERPKERSMREALTAIAGSLSIPTERAAIVRVEGIGDEAWNVEAVWACLQLALPEARQKQIEHALADDGLVQRLMDVLKSTPEAVNILFK
jgi:hypothetical protein